MYLYFIGIGGSVMHQLAIALHQKGYKVAGSDDNFSEPALSALKKSNLLPEKTGYEAQRIHQGIDKIILGMHAKKDNPELLAAQRLHIPVLSFPELIYELTRHKKRIVIAGSHGKTTTTAMIMTALRRYVAFDYLVGARVSGFERSVCLEAQHPYLIAEGDEYLSSPLHLHSKFLYYQPDIAVITGIQWDHINVFPTFEAYIETFKALIQSIPPKGTLIYNETDSLVCSLVEKSRRKDIEWIPYGLPKYKLEADRSVAVADEWGDYVKIAFWGAYNLLNLQAAYKVLRVLLGLSFSEVLVALKDFQGAAMRMNLWVDKPDYKVYRDFAHAPSKVQAVVSALKERYLNTPFALHFVLELHTFSSLHPSFMKQYADLFENTANVCIYCSEKTLQQKGHYKDIQSVKTLFQSHILCTNKGDLEHYLRRIQKKNTVILLMSSGPLDNIDRQVLQY